MYPKKGNLMSSPRDYEVHITPIDNKLSRVCSVVEITLNVENKEV